MKGYKIPVIKKKINKLNFIKFKSFCLLKHVTKRVKKQATIKGKMEDIQMV